jgi:V-type H+-transporting ATPase subunit C
VAEDGFQDMAGIDAIQKQKQGNYNLVKGQLQTLQRKQTSVASFCVRDNRPLRFSGNLATRDLSTVIDKDDVPAALADSEYLDMIYVAVSKNSAKDWENKYERLTQMIVPRSSV